MAFTGLIVIALFALLLLCRGGVLRSKPAWFVSVLLLAAAMLLRGAFMNYETLDFQNFLHVWVQAYRDQGGFAALGKRIGNYNIPYNYFLALFSYLPIRDLYLIKWLSVFFDVLLSYGVMQTVGLFCPAAKWRLSAFFLTLFLPTVVLNGALWGQCDSIYAAFAVLALYCALADKPIRSVILIAISFSFKMQAVFLMPLWLIFLFARKVKWWHLAAFPLTYLVCVLPAILLGRPIMDALYLWQMGSIGNSLNYNSSSVFAFVHSETNAALLSALGIVFAFAFLLLLYAFCWAERRRLSDRRLLLCAVMICIAVPFFLPHMHDRYFFIADALSITLAFVLPRLTPVPVFVSFASLLGYHAYLKMRFLLPMRFGAAALCLALILLIVCFAFDFGGNSKNPVDKSS